MNPLLALFLLTSAGHEAEPGTAPDEVVAAATQPNGTGLWIGGTAFVREDIEDVEQRFGPFSATPIVVLTLSESGRRKFAAAQRGRVGDVLEVALDGELIFAPVLREEIEGAEVAISGAFTMAEAIALAARLRGLPAAP